MATVPTQRTWTAGEVVTAAFLNSNVRDSVNFLLTPPRVLLRQTSAQSIPLSTWTSVTFDTEDFDNDNGHSTVSNTSRFTAVTAGWYTVGGSVAFTLAGTGQRAGTRWAVNGTALNASGIMLPQVVAVGSSYAVPAQTRDVQLAVGDYLELQAFHTNSAATAVNTFVTAEQQSCLFARYSSS